MIESIARSDDPRIAAYAHVGDSRWLRTAGLFVAEGRLVVRRLVESGRFTIESVVATPAAVESIRDILPALRSASVPAYVCPSGILAALSGFNFHRGCLALAKRPRDDGPIQSFADADRLMALEAVGNPDNVGGLFRVAAAFGVAGVVLDPSSADPLYRKAIRTSMGASLRVPFCRASEWPGDLGWLRTAGFEMVATTPHTDAEEIGEFAARTSGKVLVVVGAEGSGLSDAVLRSADHRVRVAIDPQSDSLNVAVATGIVLHALAARHPRT